MYAYRADVLEKIHALPPGDLEIRESLEQLRWLENGFNIHAHPSKATHSIGVDTPEDLEKARAIWKERNNDTDKQV
jgi:3-deoxy-manno-octulosonate cytidylyltransferase (CMP-KDO synthetase)